MRAATHGTKVDQRDAAVPRSPTRVDDGSPFPLHGRSAMNLIGIDVVAAVVTGVVWVSTGVLTCMGLARISRGR